MNAVTIHSNLIIPYFDFRAITFTTEGQEDEKMRAIINSTVEGEGMDIEYVLTLGDDYDKYFEWWKSSGPGNPAHKSVTNAFVKKPPTPLLTDLFRMRTNYLNNRDFELTNQTKYTLMLNNLYSRTYSKTVKTTIRIEPLKNPTIQNLPIIETFKQTSPNELYDSLIEANDCYRCGHFRQSAIMLRRTLELAIRLKILQNNLSDNILTNSEGYDLPLKKKIEVMYNKNLIDKRDHDDILTVKWFGDSSVHSKMPILKSDIDGIIEPKFRRFLVSLELKL